MKESNIVIETIDAFIAQYPPEIQDVLQKIRQTIHEAVPEANEKIAYGIPTFTLEGNLVHFSAFTNHIGFYPDPRGIEQFIEKLAKYRSGKGTIKFPLSEPIPFDLIREVTLWRAEQNRQKANQKKQKKSE